MNITIEKPYDISVTPNSTPNTKVKTRRLYSDAYKRKMVALYQASGCEMIYFCVIHDIALGTFQNWVKQFNNETVISALASQVEQTKRENEVLKQTLLVFMQQ